MHLLSDTSPATGLAPSHRELMAKQEKNPPNRPSSDIPPVAEDAAVSRPPAPAAAANPPPADSDEVLIEALAAGDDLALNRLMDRWQAPLRRFLYRCTQNTHDACDLAEETFVRIYQSRQKYRAGGRFSTWMFQIALNLARSRARWQKRHPTDVLHGDREDADSTRQLPSDAASPAQETLAVEQVNAVRAAIAELPEDLREVVLLFEYEEKSHAEIAAIVSATPKAVETRLYRARRRLRAALARFLEKPEGGNPGSS